MEDALDPRTWPVERLVDRIQILEQELRTLKGAHSATGPSPNGKEDPKAKPAKKVKPPKAFDASRYNTRYIALKFAYLGQKYNGLEHHVNNVTPLPCVEEVLWKALMRTRLILPTGPTDKVTWEGCEYSKCGRTDRGVSAFGQVVGLRVRSSKPVPKARKQAVASDAIAEVGNEAEADDAGSSTAEAVEAPEKPWDPIKDEIPYIATLNRILPDDIRVLAWCPDPPPGFDARFSCKERRYRYFFTNPGFAPVPGRLGLGANMDGGQIREGWLDIDAMRDAAKRLEGLHDFRNFCKLDPTKQITNFERRITHASIEEVDQTRHPAGYISSAAFAMSPDSTAIAQNGTAQTEGGIPKLYTFNVHGSAFLWHQVRMMAASLFAVGQGLEKPSVVSELLDVETNPTKPKFEMASDAPLVLWDCIFSDTTADGTQMPLKWIHADGEGGREASKGSDGDGMFGRNGLIDSLWTTWRRRKIDEVLAGSLLDLVAERGSASLEEGEHEPASNRGTRMFEGGNEGRTVGQYRPIMQKERLEHFEVMNARYREKKGLDFVDRTAKRSSDE